MVRRSKWVSPTRILRFQNCGALHIQLQNRTIVAIIQREDSFWRKSNLLRISKIDCSLSTPLHPTPGLPGAFKSPPLFPSLPHLRPCLPKKKRRRPSLRRRKSLRTKQAFAPIVRLECFTDTLFPDLWHEEREPSLSSPPLHLVLAPIASILLRPGILMED